MPDADVIIIGGGIVGLATAHQITTRLAGIKVMVVEKEGELARHQSGRNSGVIHSGIYYRPGSLKAVNCRRGREMLEDFCVQESIPFDICGKVIVAVDECDLPVLEKIGEYGRLNGVECELLDANGLRSIEPHASGIRALHVPDAGIVDFVAVCKRLAELVDDAGGSVRTHCQVTGIDARSDEVVVKTSQGSMTVSWLINCAGLYSDRIARLTDPSHSARIVPFRGEYYELTDPAANLCRNLIYPTPNPSFPFLGVHFTRMIGGGVECGPNAVLALSREGYSWSRVNLRDCWDTIAYPGFWRIARRYWRTGAQEIWRSMSKSAFVRALQRLIPDIRSEDLRRAPSGVRAQALSLRGELIDDFLVRTQGRVINVCNTPSPAATSALSIGDHVVEKLNELMTAEKSGRPCD